MADASFVPTAATTLHRKPERGGYERAQAYAVLDEALIAHVGVVIDGQPFVIPMVFGRDGDRLLLHGSVGSRLLRALDDGVSVCATVTLLDGLVLAHAQKNHSVNYRSVVILGTARRLRGEAAATALSRIVEHVAPGRSTEARPANAAELRETTVLELAIEEASTKVRTGPPAAPSDADQGLDVWVGVLPLALVPGAPVPDRPASGTSPVAPSISPWRRPGDQLPGR
jgi:nitroimidazol reductase NimA-like FMN-containing flavoprotein (pyridoxamine 5'-phosphate oxidase superfamily)